MSAFAGVLSLDGASLDTLHRKSVTAGLGAWPCLGAFETHESEGACFGYAPSAGQPSPGILADASDVLLFDGYLFSPAELAHRVGMDPGTADSVLLGAWLRGRTDAALAEIPGDYAIAWWKPAEREIILAVAPMGERTLYYHRAGARLCFANGLRALHAFPSVPIEVDPLTMAALALQRSFSDGRTLYHDIRKLGPGESLTIRADHQSLRHLWQPDPARRQRLGRDEDYVEAARSLLDQAVRRRLRGAAAPALLTSAGLDSSAVAATAARLRPGTQWDSYTAVPVPNADFTVPGNRYPEERGGVLQIAEQHRNLTPHFLHSDAPAAFEFDPTPLFEASGLPFLAISNLGWLDPAYRRMRDDGHRVLLNGQLGNLVLSHDGLRGLGDLARSGRWATLARLLPDLARDRGTTARALLRAEVMQPCLPQSWRVRSRADADAQFGLLRPEFARAIGLPAQLRREGLDLDWTWDRDSRRSRAQLLTRRAAPPSQESLAWCLYGIEQRDPFTDTDLIDFCLAIPPEQYLVNGQTRSLARRVLADRLPPAVAANPRIGAQCPEWRQRGRMLHATHRRTLDRIREVPLAAQALDIPRLERLLAASGEGGVPREAENLHRYGLPRALHLGLFLEWADQARRNRPLQSR